MRTSNRSMRAAPNGQQGFPFMATTLHAVLHERALGDAIRSANAPMLTQIYLLSHTLQEAAAHRIELPSQLAAR